MLENTVNQQTTHGILLQQAFANLLDEHQVNKDLKPFASLPDLNTAQKHADENLIAYMRNYYKKIIISDTFVWQGREIRFSDTFWDFSFENPLGDKRVGFQITFKTQVSVHEILVKLFIVYQLEKDGRFYQRTIGNAKVVQGFFEKLKPATVISSTTSDLCAAVELTSDRYKHPILLFFEFLHDLLHYQISDRLISVLNERQKRSIEAHKTPLIPTALYLSIRDALLQELMQSDFQTARDIRLGIACIQICTGLRISEVTRLTRDCLTYLPGHETQALLKYLSTKNGSGSINDLLYPLDVQTTALIQHIQDCLNPEGDCLFGQMFSTPKVAYAYHTFLSQNRKLLDLERPYDGVKQRKLSHNVVVSIPSFTQFRVYHMTEFHHAHVSAQTIRQIYGQAEPAMDDYYVRDFNQRADDVSHVEEVAQALFAKDTPLGPKAAARLEAFDTLKTAETTDSIESYCEILGRNFTIKRKACGYCVLSVGRNCKDDQQTDEYDCAYGKCSNTIHFYWNLNDNLSEARKIAFTMKRADEMSQPIAAFQEARKLLRCIQLLIVPELDDLDNRLSSDYINSFNEILDRHPELSTILSSLSEIKQEVATWQKKANELINSVLKQA